MSDDVVWPQSVLDKFADDKLFKEQQAAAGTTTVRRLRKKQDLFELVVEGATNGKSTVLDDNLWFIEDVQSGSINMKIKYDNPELMSMTDQSEQDRMQLKLKKPLIGKNGLEMKTDGFDDDGNTARGI